MCFFFQKKNSAKKSISMWPGRVTRVFFGLVFFLWSGCGPDLTRPGYKPPPDKPAIAVFQDAQKQLLSQLRFSFLHTNFQVLNGVANDVQQVISKYPPSAQMALNPQVLTLHIEGLIEQVFLEFMGSKNFDERDVECVRDYTELCPTRWVDIGDGVTCESPPELFENSECRTVQFGGLTPLAKSATAWNCGNSVYPCRNACMQNFSAICPEGWSSPMPAKKSVCVAPPTYFKPCVTVYDFADHNWTQKRKFADMCKVKWPCII